MDTFIDELERHLDAGDVGGAEALVGAAASSESVALGAGPARSAAQLDVAEAMLAFHRRDFRAAAEHARRAWGRAPNDPLVLRQLALVCVATDDLPGAEGYARKAVERQADARDLRLLGEVLQRRGRLGEAE